MQFTDLPNSFVWLGIEKAILAQALWLHVPSHQIFSSEILKAVFPKYLSK
jgi:hypothetical protein